MPPFAVALKFRTSSDAAVLKGVCSVPVAAQRSSLLSDPQLPSCIANTHLNLSRWSPHQAGGLIISSAECSRGHVSALSRSHRRHHGFCFFCVGWVSPQRQFILTWRGGQMLAAVARMWGVTSVSRGGEWGFFILQQGFKRRRNGRNDSNSWQGIWEDVQMLFCIWKHLFTWLLHCTVEKCSCPLA